MKQSCCVGVALYVVCCLIELYKTIKSPNKEKRDQSCPICRAPIRPGYDTKYGKVIVCMNYPRCSFIAIVDPKDNKGESNV